MTSSSPAHAGVRPGGPVIEIDHRGPGQGSVVGRRRAEALASGCGPWSSKPNPSSMRISADGGAVERDSLGGQPGGDLVSGKALAAQLDHPAPGAVSCRGGAWRRAGLSRRREQLQLPGPVLADQVDHRPAGVAEPLPGFGIRQPVDVPGAQRLVAPLVHQRRGGERLRSLSLWRSSCHMRLIPDVHWNRCRPEPPALACSSLAVAA